MYAHSMTNGYKNVRPRLDAVWIIFTSSFGGAYRVCGGVCVGVRTHLVC